MPKDPRRIEIEKTKFDDDRERRLRAENRFEHLEHRLHTVERWMPRYIIEHPEAKPNEVVRKLKEEKKSVAKELKNLEVECVGEIQRRDLPLPDGDELPLRERIQRAMGDVKFLGGLKAGIKENIAITGAEEETESSTVSGFATTNGYLDVGAFYSYENGEDFEDIFRTGLVFNPDFRYDIGALEFKQDIKVCDYARLNQEAAFPFNLGQAPFDGFVVWEAITRLNVPYALNADEAEFSVDWILCEQPNATRCPWNYEFDKRVSGFIRSVHERRDVGFWTDQKTLTGSFAVEKNWEPAVNIGFSVNIEVTDDGRAGTKRDWGSLQVIGPYGIKWCISYWYFRV